MARRPVSFPEMWDVIKDIHRRLHDLETAPSLASSSIGSGGLVVREDGQIVSDDFESGVAGYRLGGDSLEVNDILLRGGIIGNDALANPVTFGQVSSFQQGFAATTSDVILAPTTIPVPAGFTKALVMATAYIGFFNSSAAGTYLYVQTRIEDENAGEVPVFISNGSWNGGTATKTKLLTGISGSIDIASVIRSQAAMPYDASARTFVEALAIFLR